MATNPVFDRIEREERRWYVVFAASSLHNVLMAVEAGLGLSLLPVSATPGYRLRPYAPFGSEEAIFVALYAWESTGAVSGLVAAMQTALATRSGRRPN